ncbi:DUF4245 domain-containing protein [Streptomyces beihaiensis]|uniref:DUF4245 domain-containing protein n=1 Tax=Streptomyces beihaiensis TaxID=2984495 RepID=A0ABT3TYB9_9ACTN|nr:DUF4245 domain-containing protein [Streptomyces beihaiensis]MCX3062048.1 DUF4245 domain-containing protein [Streptomyces beihaiensis]
MAARNGKKTVGSMVLSLGVCVLAAGVIYLFVPHDDSKGAPVARKDYRVALLTARRTASYPVAAPEGLPRTWKATSVDYQEKDHQSWHLGFLDPRGQYVAVEQSADNSAAFISQASQGAEETSRTQRIGGEEWRRYKGDKYDALVLRQKGSATVVTGTADFGQLTKMAEALRMKRGS